MKRFGRIVLRTAFWLVGGTAGLFLLAVGLLRMPAVQTRVVGEVAHYLENRIGTPVRIGYVNIAFPKKIVLEDVYFEDRGRDTLLAGERLSVDMDMLALLKSTVRIRAVLAEGVTAKIGRAADGSFNFDYILRAFPAEKDTASTSALVFDIDEVGFNRVRFAYRDAVAGMNADLRLEHFRTKVRTFDLTGDRTFALPDIKMDGLAATIERWEAPPGAEIPDTAGVENPAPLPEIILKNIALADVSVRYRDLAAALAGSLGIAPTGNIDPTRRNPSMFEPIHGSAFDIMGQGLANPIGTFWSCVMLLDHLGEPDAAARLMRAIEATTANPALHTRDLGGRATTRQVTDAVIAQLTRHS